MKNLMKLIVITALTALLLCMVITCASADEKIYTSPVFRLPKDKLEQWAETQPDVPEGEEEPEEPEEDETTGDTETDEPQDETGEPQDETGEPQTDESGAPVQPKREVRISSSQGKIVKKNEFITLTSKLIGFSDDEVLTFQWQVDRGDGLGWVDVEGATGDTYKYSANEETITYKWRLIVNVEE